MVNFENGLVEAVDGLMKLASWRNLWLFLDYFVGYDNCVIFLKGTWYTIAHMTRSEYPGISYVKSDGRLPNVFKLQHNISEVIGRRASMTKKRLHCQNVSFKPPNVDGAVTPSMDMLPLAFM